MTSHDAVDIERLNHRYGHLLALDGLDLTVAFGEIFGLLGPNGGGKTTLFRLLCTLLPVQDGHARICGADVMEAPHVVRNLIGVTFQSPSLDGRLTVAENLKHQGRLYGLSGRILRTRIAEALSRIGLQDRKTDRVDALSGGLKRRVEIAKGLLHQPKVLLLDEPSTGLDPGARGDLWNWLMQIRHDTGMTIVVTTHLMEEADQCGRLAILDRGRLVAQGTPDELRASVGGDCLSIQTTAPAELSTAIRERFSVEPTVVGTELRIEHSDGHELLRDLCIAFPDRIRSISLGKPTLDDVFIARTGRRLDEVAVP